MGSFYTNLTVRCDDQERVTGVLRSLGRSAFISPAMDGMVVVYDEACEEQDPEELASLAADLSGELGAGVLGALNHDDDVLILFAAQGGEVVDTYNSCPAFFTGEGSESPEGGDARVIAQAVSPNADTKALEAALRDEELFLATERHEAIVQALGLPGVSVGFGFSYLEEGEFPEGLSPEEMRRV